MNRQDFGCLT